MRRPPAGMSAVTATLTIFLAVTAAASPVLPDPEEEARARALFAEIRCVVCQNESIDASQADIAADLRGIVREQVAAGRSDDEIRRFLVDRYGEFVLFRPAFSLQNALLWAAPFAVVLIGGAVVVVRSRAGAGVAPLDVEEEQALRALQKEPDDGKVT